MKNHYIENDTADMAVSVSGTLSVKYINGTHGLFPIAWLKSPLGRFRVRDSWVETLDEGEYEGVFEVCEFSLYTYKAYEELRTCIAVKIFNYTFNDYVEETQSEPETLPDPIEEEGRVAPGFTRELPTGEDSEAHIALLQSYESDWQFGDDYKVDTTMPRANIIACHSALKALGYGYDIKSQTYRMPEVSHG